MGVGGGGSNGNVMRDKAQHMLSNAWQQALSQEFRTMQTLYMGSTLHCMRGRNSSRLLSTEGRRLLSIFDV